MTELITKFQAIWATRDQGATAVEYGLMVALIAVVIVGAVFALGGTLQGMFQSVTKSITP
jgi:pilus assembly protein Flp/PilA